MTTFTFDKKTSDNGMNNMMIFWIQGYNQYVNVTQTYTSIYPSVNNVIRYESIDEIDIDTIASYANSLMAGNFEKEITPDMLQRKR